MTTQACVTRVLHFTRTSGVYSLTVEMITVIEDTGLSYTNEATCTSTNINPLLPNWRSRVRTAVVDRAFALYALDVAEVLFPDFGILGA